MISFYRRPLLGLAVLSTSFVSVHAERAEVVVSAQTFGDFVHHASAHTPAAERLSIALGEGKFNVAGESDSSLDAVPFAAVARRLSIELSRHGFAVARDPAHADLLILVHRGRTSPRDNRVNSGYDLDEGGAGSLRSGGGLVTAPGNLPIVGYTVGAGTDLIESGSNLQTIATGLGWKARLDELEYSLGNVATDYRYEELVDALLKPRYYIVLEAFDMDAWHETGKRELRWRAALSFRADRGPFDARYEPMIKAAAPHFGRTTPKELAREWVVIP